MKIMLVQPPSEFLRQAYGVKKKNAFGHQPPLGLGYIASYLESDGHDVVIQDAAARDLTIEESLAEIVAFSPSLVGITVLTNYANAAKELAGRVKKALPETTVLVGGAHATYFFDEILNDMPGVDHVLYGEADTVINEYARKLQAGKDVSGLKGLVYRDSQGKSVVNPPADMLTDLDQVPMPAWHLFDFSLYRPLPMQYRRLPFFTMTSTRGCWWRKCKFCFQAGRKAVPFRRQSPERVVAEVERLYHDHGIREIAFWDDTFVLNIKWLKRFKALLEEKQIDLSWSGFGRVDSLDEEVLQTVKDAGCWNMFIGIESGNQSLIDAIDKGITKEQARKVFEITNRLGIDTRGAFMLGLPGETPEMGAKTAAFARELDPTFAIFYATHPRFGTQLYDIAMEQGAFLNKSFKGMSKVTYVPDGYEGPEQLERTITKAYRDFYLRPSYFWKMLKRIRSLRTIKELALGVILFMGLSRSKE